MIEIDPLTTANKLMHADDFIKEILQAGLQLDEALPVQAASSELLSLALSNCHNSFRSKFALTMKGMELLFF